DLRGQPAPKLIPEARIRPFAYFLLEPALQVIAAARQRAHAAEREAACVIRIHELVRRGRHVGENSEPSERIGAFEGLKGIRWNALAGNAMEAVAAGDEIAHDVVAAAAMGIAHHRMRSVGSVDD